ncbi:MAG: nuclear transport factor 2 family protein [Saprospiraceae bacterium]|nr:nuclear transport factor 2 family protein [Saprospiraceae bacterium]
MIILHKAIFPILLVFPLGLWGQSDSTPERIRQLHQEKFEWMVLRDTARLSQLLALDVVYVHSNGWHETRAEMLSNIGSGRIRYQRVEVLDAAVRAYGTAYIVNGRARFEVALEDQSMILLLDYTEVYVREETGELLLVSRHACRVPE